MATCADCGKKLGFFEAGSGGLCGSCSLGFEGRQIIDAASEDLWRQQDLEERIQAILVTSETSIEGEDQGRE